MSFQDSRQIFEPINSQENANIPQGGIDFSGNHSGHGSCDPVLCLPEEYCPRLSVNSMPTGSWEWPEETDPLTAVPNDPMLYLQPASEGQAALVGSSGEGQELK